MGLWWWSSLKHQSISPQFFTRHPSTTLIQPDANHDLSLTSEMIINVPYTHSIYLSESDSRHGTGSRIRPGSKGIWSSNTRLERVGYQVRCGTCQSQRQHWLKWSPPYDENAEKFCGHGKFDVVVVTHLKPLCLWITLPVMQVFSARVSRRSVPDP